ncbi:DUF2489 domain-containing protein [Neptunicella marina]|uniref:DUF2489 domain-containing protein n=1 Tax=Neptunicella marina TaxID=2125989 RepID=A0A8J6IW70_9ALTE|nr:DUF2489 domain-containing protein [Neptunicella marina]MBC3766631.1 DUF2489 domain-containing protein [Neptunicella marina]
MIVYLLLTIGLLIIAGLGIYAGRLLFLLKQQNTSQQRVREQRIKNIMQSIDTIAMAMEQQQCDISEGCIRLCVLLETLPLEQRPDFVARFPALHQLYAQIKHMPTHEEREKQPKHERRAMDKQREELEAQAESSILKEIALLREFNPLL